jgi:hypothetical protein
MSRKVWRCFHCDEVFRSRVDAENHFGKRQGDEPACLIKAAGEFALLRALRSAQEDLCQYYAEDSNILRAMHSQAADYEQRIIRAEEQGYARGLRDARTYPETLGLVKLPECPGCVGCPH